MAHKIRTEADRKRSPKPTLPNGVSMPVSRGQKRSLERGSATRSKKNPASAAAKAAKAPKARSVRLQALHQACFTAGTRQKPPPRHRCAGPAFS